MVPVEAVMVLGVITNVVAPVTVTVAVPTITSSQLVAVTVVVLAVPEPTAVTRPVWSIVATVGSSVAQNT